MVFVLTWRLFLLSNGFIQKTASKLEDIVFMKYLATLVIAIALAGVANASVINISMNPNTGLPALDVNKGLLGNNSPQTNFDFLLNQISLYDNFSGASLPTPSFAGYFDGSNNTVSLTGFDYAVIHYGKGPGGQGQGGGVEFFYLNGMTGNYTFSANGLGPNGLGGFSSIRLFSVGGASVPEGGTTAVLFGSACAALFFVRRFCI
jgi:hypothetical protein